jgi:DNA polymerase-1
MANITNEFDLVGNVKLLGKELRQCWTVPEERLLVGVDAEGIQLRIFAHYIQDSEFTDALVRGRKDDKTDPHSLNQRILGSVCKSRAAAKRFIFALLLGAGVGKLAEILACDVKSAQQALERLLVRYTGFARLKQEVIPADAERGWFTGIDGRRVRILGETAGSRRHLAMSGYLQNGEAVIIKTAAVIAAPQIEEYDSFLLNIIHDEYQVETPNDLRIAVVVAEIIDEAIRESGRRLNLRCPLAGSYRNDHGKYTIGKNWYQTH